MSFHDVLDKIAAASINLYIGSSKTLNAIVLLSNEKKTHKQ